jgi:hypothetical protein
MNLFSTPLPFYAPPDDAPAADPKIDAAPAGDAPAADAAADAGGDKPSSFLDSADDPAIEKPIAAPATWPEDWRDKMAGEDKALRKRLDRFPEPTAILKSFTELETRFKKGGPAADEPMPDPEKEPEKAKEWRAARGVPDDPTGYAIPDTVKALVTDADKPKLADFTEAMHKAGISASAVAPVMEWYFKEQAAGVEAVRQADLADKEEVQETLRSEWGADFRANATVAKRFAEEITPGFDWFSARLPDGRVLGNVPEFVKSLAQMGLREYGDVAFAGGEQTNKTTARKEELERMMANDPQAYRADPKLSKEYEQIMEAELKRSARQR